MAKFSVAVEQIKSVEDYLNTDKLSIVRVLGYNFIIKRNKYKGVMPLFTSSLNSFCLKNIIDELDSYGKLTSNKSNQVKKNKLRGNF